MKDLRIAKDFLSHYLPQELQEQIILDSLRLEDASFIDKELKASAADVLYSVDFKNGERGYILVLAEHQRTPQELAPLRFMQYRFKAIQRDLDQNPGKKILPIVYILVFYNGKEPWVYSTDFFDLFGENRELAAQVFNKPFKLIDVKRIPEDELKKHRTSGMFEMTMRLNYALNQLKEFLEILSHFGSFLNTKEFGDYYERVLSYHYQLAEVGDPHEFLNAIRGILPEAVEEKAMTWAEQLRQEGLERGLERGLILGKAELFEKTVRKCGSEKAAADFLDMELSELLQILQAKKELEKNTKH